MPEKLRSSIINCETGSETKSFPVPCVREYPTAGHRCKKQQLAGADHKSCNKVPARHRHGGQRLAPLPDTYLDKGTQDKEDEI